MKILLVDDVALVLRGVSRMIESEHDWDVETALSGTEALQMLEEGDFNVIVSDMRMPGIDGAQLLDAVETRFPNVVRVVLSGQADRKNVLQAIRPMHQYLSKPCDPQELIDLIRRAELFQQTIPSTEVISAIGRANCLPSQPTVVTELNAELESESSTPTSIATLVSQDPMLCAKILQVANSAICGLRRPVVDVERAVTVLGKEITRALTLSLPVFSSDRASTARLARRFFAHSIHVARISRRLAAWDNADAATMNLVFSGGLLHDIGTMVLLNAFEDRYTRVSERSAGECLPDFALEMEEFGASHAGIGAYLLEMWGLPSELTATVGSHHSPGLCSRSTLACQIVFAANWIADGGDEFKLELHRGEVSEEFYSRLRKWKTRHNEETEEDVNG